MSNPPLRLRLAFSGLMSLLMSCLLSAWLTWLNLGLSPAILEHWLSSFAAPWPAAFVIVMLVVPPVQRFARRLAA